MVSQKGTKKERAGNQQIGIQAPEKYLQPTLSAPPHSNLLQKRRVALRALNLAVIRGHRRVLIQLIRQAGALSQVAPILEQRVEVAVLLAQLRVQLVDRVVALAHLVAGKRTKNGINQTKNRHEIRFGNQKRNKHVGSTGNVGMQSGKPW